MKKIITIVIVILLLGGNLYAAGDLVVNGTLGVGTSTPIAKAGIKGVNEVRTLHVDNELNQGDISSFIEGAEYSARLTGSAMGSVYGFTALLNLMTTANTAKELMAASVYAQIGRPDTPGTTTVQRTVGFDYVLNRHYNNQRTYNITNSYGLRTGIEEGSATGAPVNITNFYHQYMKNPGALTTINISNLAGLWIDQQTTGTSNYGLVLNGDGAGADLVFGDAGGSCRPSIYAVGGFVKAKNKNCIESPLSPHDPETGEWIFYSKNLKTGKTVRVNMEQLVKAVEKLTGETFMIETLVEDK
jgi:hypothetical protein